MREFRTKEDVIGTVIKCTSREQGKLIIKFYEDLGVENDETPKHMQACKTISVTRFVDSEIRERKNIDIVNAENPMVSRGLAPTLS